HEILGRSLRVGRGFEGHEVAGAVGAESGWTIRAIIAESSLAPGSRPRNAPVSCRVQRSESSRRSSTDREARSHAVRRVVLDRGAGHGACTNAARTRPLMDHYIPKRRIPVTLWSSDLPGVAGSIFLDLDAAGNQHQTLLEKLNESARFLPVAVGP